MIYTDLDLDGDLELLNKKSVFGGERSVGTLKTQPEYVVCFGETKAESITCLPLPLSQNA